MKPFSSDCDYLDAEMAWVATRTRRMAAERDAKVHGPGYEEHELIRLRAEDERLRADIDRRLAVHRVEGTFTLGLDALCERGLDDQERLVVVLLLPAAIAATLGDQVLAGSGAWVSGGELLWWLAPSTVGDWVLFRRIFEPEGRLRSTGIVEVRSGSELGAAATLSGSWFLSREAFDIVVGLDAGAGR